MMKSNAVLWIFKALILLSVFIFGCDESDTDLVDRDKVACENKFSMINIMSLGTWIKTDESLNCSYDQSYFEGAVYQCSTQEVSAFYSGTGDAPSCSFRQNCSLTASDGITSELRFSASSSLEMDPPYTGNVTISKRDERIVDSVNGETVTDILFRCDFTVTDIE